MMLNNMKKLKNFFCGLFLFLGLIQQSALQGDGVAFSQVELLQKAERLVELQKASTGLRLDLLCEGLIIQSLINASKAYSIDHTGVVAKETKYKLFGLLSILCIDRIAVSAAATAGKTPSLSDAEMLIFELAAIIATLMTPIQINAGVGNEGAVLENSFDRDSLLKFFSVRGAVAAVSIVYAAYRRFTLHKEAEQLKKELAQAGVEISTFIENLIN